MLCGQRLLTNRKDYPISVEVSSLIRLSMHGWGLWRFGVSFLLYSIALAQARIPFKEQFPFHRHRHLERVLGKAYERAGHQEHYNNPHLVLPTSADEARQTEDPCSPRVFSPINYGGDPSGSQVSFEHRYVRIQTSITYNNRSIK